MKDTLIIIPCYNEEKNIVIVLDKLLNCHYDADILVVNDGSSDSTLAMVQGLPVKVVSHPFNLGYGAAVQTGYKYAAAHGYDYLVQLDADGQHDVSFVKAIMDRLCERDKVDLVIGSRFLSGETQIKFGPLKKGAVGFFRGLLYLFGKQTVTDPTSGYWGISRRLFTYFSRMGNFPSDFPDADVLLQSILSGFLLVEIPVKMYDRTNGVSMHQGLKPLYYMIKVPLSILIVLLRIKKAKKGA